MTTNNRHRSLHLLLLASAVKAQVDTDSINSATNAVSPFLRIVFLILTPVLIFIALFYYFLWEHCLNRRNQLLLHRISSTAANQVQPKKFGGGLDPAVVTAFPELTYSNAKAKWVSIGPDCVICLGPFEDHETLRLLPKCGHVFHPDCVGVWLANHTTCPCCRGDLLEEKEPASKNVILDVGNATSRSTNGS